MGKAPLESQGSISLAFKKPTEGIYVSIHMALGADS